MDENRQYIHLNRLQAMPGPRTLTAAMFVGMVKAAQNGIPRALLVSCASICGVGMYGPRVSDEGDPIGAKDYKDKSGFEQHLPTVFITAAMNSTQSFMNWFDVVKYTHRKKDAELILIEKRPDGNLLRRAAAFQGDFSFSVEIT